MNEAQGVEPLDKSEQKLCIHCANIATVGSGDWTKFRCMAPQNKNGINLVTGQALYKFEFCSDARKQGNACSNWGNWFIPKPEVPAPSLVPTNETFQVQDLDVLANSAAARVEALRKKKQSKLSSSDLENL